MGQTFEIYQSVKIMWGERSKREIELEEQMYTLSVQGTSKGEKISFSWHYY